MCPNAPPTDFVIIAHRTDAVTIAHLFPGKEKAPGGLPPPRPPELRGCSPPKSQTRYGGAFGQTKCAPDLILLKRSEMYVSECTTNRCNHYRTSVSGGVRRPLGASRPPDPPSWGAAAHPNPKQEMVVHSDTPEPLQGGSVAEHDTPRLNLPLRRNYPALRVRRPGVHGQVRLRGNCKTLGLLSPRLNLPPRLNYTALRVNAVGSASPQ
jgi:hypothetical protein